MAQRRAAGRQGRVGASGSDSGDMALAIADGESLILIEQHVEMFEAMTGWETCNSYSVFNAQKQPLYIAKETSSMCCRQCCKSSRAFEMNLTLPQSGNLAIRIERPYRLYWHEITVRCFDTQGRDRMLGTVKRQFAIFSRIFSVFDASGSHRFTISGSYFSPWTFELHQIMPDGRATRAGTIKKKWSGLAQELFTDADNFGIEFTSPLARGDKCLLLAAVFLIDFMYFEVSSISFSRPSAGNCSRRIQTSISSPDIDMSSHSHISPFKFKNLNFKTNSNLFHMVTWFMNAWTCMRFFVTATINRTMMQIVEEGAIAAACMQTCFRARWTYCKHEISI